MALIEFVREKVRSHGENAATLLGIPQEEVKDFLNSNGKLSKKSLNAFLKGAEIFLAPKTEELWTGRDVCFCLPWYKSVAPDTAFCLMAVWDKSMMRLEKRSDDAMIARSRNQLAKRFLRTEAKWSVWVDEDMVFPFGHAGMYITMTGMTHLAHQFASLNTITRLLSWNKTIVGGCYWDRKGGGRLIAGGDQALTTPIPYDTLYAARFCGTGILAVHRKVFEDIAAKFPETMSDNAIGNEAGFFTPINTDKRMMGEDEAFAWRAKEAGHPSYLDLGLICGHIGAVVHGMPLKGSRL